MQNCWNLPIHRHSHKTKFIGKQGQESKDLAVRRLLWMVLRIEWQDGNVNRRNQDKFCEQEHFSNLSDKSQSTHL